MYNQFFHFNQQPFSIAPDPRYLFMSERHREALAHLLYGVDSGGGFVLLTGEIGTGKTTICRCLLEQIPDNCNVAYIFNPKLTVDELLRSICDEFRIELAAHRTLSSTVKEYVDALNAYFLSAHAEGKNNVLIIDEAQNLSPDVLEQLRLLTNLETNERKLLQIILIGQPELRTMLARPELEQLAQRVIARYHLGALTAPETAAYVQHRLAIAGATGTSPFPAQLTRQIQRITRGVPRRINLLCDRALLGAYASNRQQVSRAILAKAAHEVFGHEASASHTLQFWRHALLGMTGAALISAAAWALHTRQVSPTRKALPTSTIAAAMPLPSDPHSLFGNTDLRDENAAYRQLARLWGVTLPNGDPCEAAKSRSLLCYKSTAGLTEIRRLDRPAILTLRDDRGTICYVLLTGLTATGATLKIDGNSAHAVSISLLALMPYFHGEFASFWRTPPGYLKKLLGGDRGEAVDWTAARLAKLNGLAPPAANQVVDGTMQQQVRAFQIAQGVKADGVAGAKTFMLLNAATGVGEPRLQNNAPANGASGK